MIYAGAYLLEQTRLSLHTSRHMYIYGIDLQSDNQTCIFLSEYEDHPDAPDDKKLLKVYEIELCGMYDTKNVMTEGVYTFNYGLVNR